MEIFEDTLGLDLGTNSIGWAIVRKSDNNYQLLHRGVDIFPEGVAREKGNEKPMVQTRTQARALRRHYFRRRLRKIEVLKVLVKHCLCPYLSNDMLKQWKQTKTYPMTDEFLEWQRTDDNKDKNPYFYRNECLTRKLDLAIESERYLLGRAIYHLAQRRGFLSNRKDKASESDGEVKKGITKLSEEIDAAGCQYLGEYFYRLYQNGEKIRGTYTARNEHYLKEFYAICGKQELGKELVDALYRAIFYQRPLKSQKGSVGKCTFEPAKSRCPLSHPRFEEFRMLSFINNIKVKTLYDKDYRPLNDHEIKAINPLFMRKSKPDFDFEEIAKAIAGRKENYGYKDDEQEVAYRFNYKMSALVSGCPVSSSLKAIFGDDWLNEIASVYTKANGKSEDEILNDVWHAMFSFDDDDRLKEWSKTNLQLDDDQASKFAAIHIPQGYASLSLCAINKILVYLRRGMRYDEAVFLANVKAVLPQSIVEDDDRFSQIESDLYEEIINFKPDKDNQQHTKHSVIKQYLEDIPGVNLANVDKKIYHPSMIETYPDAVPNKNGVVLLGSPRTSSVRNPMAMRALFRLRHLINQLIKEGKVNQYTKVNIEFSRGLNDANKRKAIEQYQKDLRDKRDKARKEIQQFLKKDIEPTEDDILRYLLWKEQDERCLYTGETIDVSDIIGANPKYDFEHTVPRSRGGDDSMMNKTLCQAEFNRAIKRNQLPSEIPSGISLHKSVIETLKWKEKIEKLESQIKGLRKASASANTKESKDNAIVKRHKLQMELDYWKGKNERFTMTEVSGGFTNRQGVDIGIIGRYARMYLKTYFNQYRIESSNADSRDFDVNRQIFTIKGATTAEFRVMWGLQEEYTKKERVNHVHHCIDAIVIACIDRAQYQKWAAYKRDHELANWDGNTKPRFEKPWKTFTEDVKSVSDGLLISHYTADNMLRQSKKKMRIRGRIQQKDGKVRYQTGDTARGSLHKDTFYGAIKKDEQVVYVSRQSLDKLLKDSKGKLLSTKDAIEACDKIVDSTVASIVKNAIVERGVEGTLSATVWMNKAKGIPINKVRVVESHVKSPIHLKKQRDVSLKEYKRYYHVLNDGNYCMAVYEGTNAKGKVKRSYMVVSNLEASRMLNSKTAERNIKVVPMSDKDENPLKWVLKVGTMVLFYDNSPSEVYDAVGCDLSNRLYKIYALESDGRLKCIHSQDAEGASKEKTAWNKECKCCKMRVTHNNFKALIEGYDFELTVTGEIIFKRFIGNI